MTSKTTTIEELRAHAEGSDRPATKRLRQIHDEVEKAIAQGVSRKKIHAILQKDGYDITFKSFVVTLSRLRKEKSEGKRRTQIDATPQAPPSPLTGSNPLKALASSKKEGEFSAIPVKFELDEAVQHQSRKDKQ